MEIERKWMVDGWLPEQLDYPMISGCTLIISITVLVANFLLDMLYGLIDPRIKATQVEEG